MTGVSEGSEFGQVGAVSFGPEKIMSSSFFDNLSLLFGIDAVSASN